MELVSKISSLGIMRGCFRHRKDTVVELNLVKSNVLKIDRFLMFCSSDDLNCLVMLEI